jgi:CRP/FNR family transcriptional regulator, cyclic AMP receptor protein
MNGPSAAKTNWVASAAMASRSAYLEHLASVPLFSSLSRRDLQKIARASDEVEAKAGRVLVDQGRTGHEFFLIIDGKATVRRNGRKLTELGPGEYFGELALLDRGPRSATVSADTDMTLLVLGQREFAGVLDEVPGMAHKMLATMAQRLREADTRAIGH